MRKPQESTLSEANKHPHPNTDVPTKFEPGALPVEPDEGASPAQIPSAPEHEHANDPEA